MKIRTMCWRGIPVAALLVLAANPLAQAQEADASESSTAVAGAEPGPAETPDETVARALQIFGSGDIIQAMQILQPVAEQGHPRAQVRLAYIYDQARYYEKALHWYQQAAEAGNTEAAIGLAVMYAAGDGTERDPVTAGQWMRKAAENGEVRAMVAIADAYEQGGLGMEIDAEQAVHWYTRAAEHGSRSARQRLSEAYTRGELGLPQDVEAAQRWSASPVTDE